jgi:hypothetical protein
LILSDEETRSGEEAIREIRERDDDDVTDEEREFLDSEGVKLNPDEQGNRPVA